MAPAAGARESRRYLDPTFVSRLKKLDLKAKLVVEGFMTGLHRSPYHGFSVEFAEHRPYMPGDPIRNIDWKVYGKSDRYYIKQYEDETNLRSYILLDVSRSMTYAGPGAISKLEYAKHLAAAIAYLMVHQQDAVGLLTFSDAIQRFIPPRSSGRHLQLILQELESLTPGTNTDVGTCLSSLSERIRRRGLILLFSDLMDEPERVLQGLKHFRYRQHEVIVFQILDETEWTFPFQEEIGFVDLESGEEVVAQSWILAEEYRRRVEAWREEYRRACGEQQIDLVTITNQTPFDRALLRFLEKRARLH
ncbi:MAG TPA: DUF58 domain-containing protein [Candidatus Udaeobacter sp.]|nr:DUF58 domain-containing protein [Candidatus Udaeobacter sp.]